MSSFPVSVRTSTLVAASALAVLVSIPLPARAQDDVARLREELAATRRELAALSSDYERRLAELEARLALASPASAAPGRAARLVAPTGRQLVDVSLSGLFAAGTSTAREEVIRELEGGAHDPHDRGFTLQNLELSLGGAVDPYLRGDAHLVFQIDEEGESLVEVEEAYLTSLSLPAGLQVKAGQYFTEFGRLNPQHPHQWQFADQPVVNTRMFGGDGLRGPGARLAWLTPAPWYSELFVGAQRAKGETMASFLSSPEEEGFAGHPFAAKDVRSADDLLYSARWLNSFDLSDAATLNVGLSALVGPNATGEDERTSIQGVDLYYKWMAPDAEKGWPFVTVQAEVVRRSYGAGSFVDELGDPVSAEQLEDWGAYAQSTWGFRPRWTIGARVDWADGDEGLAEDNRLNSLRDSRRRYSAALSWFPTEYSKLRFQVNHDEAEFLRDGAGGSEQSFWIQWEFNLGAHAAHSF